MNHKHVYLHTQLQRIEEIQYVLFALTMWHILSALLGNEQNENVFTLL